MANVPGTRRDSNMHLSDDTLIHYLLARNVLPEEAAMSGTLRVIDRSSRNRNRRIQWEGAGVFVKQVRDPGPQFEETLRRDATCYWLVRDNPDFLALRDFVPRLRGFDSALHVLVIEDLEGFESLSTIGQRESSSLSVERAAELGEFLAVCHTRAGRSLMQDAANPWFAKRMPWVLTIPETPRHELAFPSRGAMALSDHVSTHRFFREMLGDLRRQWQVVAFIHGDMKWDNVLVRVSAASPSAVSIRIIDWELADFGDPLWDIAGILQSLLLESFHVSKFGRASSGPALDGAANDPRPAAIRQGAVAFWLAYARGRNWSADESRIQLLRSIRFASGRLVQSAYEFASALEDMSPAVGEILELSRLAYQDPARLGRESLGLSS